MVLVTGGTGLLGTHLLHALLSTGHQVRAIHRTTSNREHTEKLLHQWRTDYDAGETNWSALFPNGIERLAIETQEVQSRDTLPPRRTGSRKRANNNTTAHVTENPKHTDNYGSLEWFLADVNNVPQIEDAYQGITAVFHCAASLSDENPDYDESVRINKEGTANVVNLCLHHDIPLCHTSSVATLGDPLPGKPINEEDFFNLDADHGVYALTKYGAEMEVWRGTQEGLRATIVNPAVILGTGFYKTGSGGLVARIAKGMNWAASGTIPLVDVRDTVYAMLLLMHDQVWEQRFVLISGAPKYAEFVKMIQRAAGKKESLMPVPRWATWLGLRFGSLVRLFGGRFPLTRDRRRSLHEDTQYDGSLITKEHGLQYRSLEDSVRWVTDSLR